MDPTSPQADDLSTQGPQKKSSRTTRKRASRACLSCRARKVRCDVSQRGDPCTNCHLDGEPCLVTRRTSKFRRAQETLTDEPQASVPIEEAVGDADDIEMVNGPTSVGNQNSPTLERPGPGWDHNLSRYSSNADSINPEPASKGELGKIIFSMGRPRFNTPRASYHHQPPTTRSLMIPSEVIYCRYPFLTVADIHRIPQQDASYLELQGCFKVPARPLLNEFVRQYFLHVHPILPVVNEGDFWALYDHDDGQLLNESFPLLLFQAMLFAASTFVSWSTVRALGYPDTRSLRTTLLRRTKLLYDLECESSPLVLAQASILLSMASLSPTGKPNTVWLSLAIENAKRAEAHLYTTVTSDSLSKQRNVQKRLWWCCIMRDRSMGLLLRRPINITREQFDCEEDPLKAEDLRDELQRSKVYRPSTKWKLAKILSQSVQLYTKLTDVLMLLYPPSGKKWSTQQENSILPLQACKSGLREWNTRASLSLSVLQSVSDLRTSSETDKEQESITLYKNFMYMYYHTARIGLCHHEALLSEDNELAFPPPKDLATISETQRELQRAISDITECHEELFRLDLAQWLPSSAMGFIALPLILSILDTKLSPPLMGGIQQSTTVTQSQLNLLIEFLKAYWTRYDGVYWISEVVRQTIGLAQLNGLGVQRKNLNINWTDVFAFHPRSYLRLVLGLDLSLNKGRLAQDADFPAKLRGLFSLSVNPLQQLVEGHYPRLG
ncbi:hypothetical protein NW759_017500, partial [Fusarium solani]